MHVLAIGTLTTQDFQQHLPEEGEVVARWFQEGALKDVYLKADRSGPILVLNDTDTVGAQKRMADLPFVGGVGFGGLAQVRPGSEQLIQHGGFLRRGQGIQR